MVDGWKMNGNFSNGDCSGSGSDDENGFYDIDSIMVSAGDDDDDPNDVLLESEEPKSEADNNIIEFTLTPDMIQQERKNVDKGTDSIGLTLRKSASFLDLVQMKLSQAADQSRPMSDTEKKSKTVRLLACLHHLLKLEIGRLFYRIIFYSNKQFYKQMESKYEADLAAKCYYGRKKLIWEILNEDGLKIKMEINWYDVLAIQVDLQENQPGILAIELNQPPTFFQETNPQPRKHTNWKMTTDFTQNHQASIFRRHVLIFPPGRIDRHYQKMIQQYKRLFQLTLRGFPSLDSPYFNGNVFHSPEFSFESNPPQHTLSIPHRQHYHHSIIPTKFLPHHHHHHHQVRAFQQMPNEPSFCISESPSPMSALKEITNNNHVHENRMNAIYGPVMQNSNHVHENQMNAIYSPVRQNSNAVIVRGNQLMIDISSAAVAAAAAQAAIPFASSSFQHINPTFFLNQRNVPLLYEETQVESSSPTHGNLLDTEHYLMGGDLQVDGPDEPRVLSKVNSMFNLLKAPMEATAAANVAAAGATSQMGFKLERVVEDSEVLNDIAAADNLYAENRQVFMQPHNCVPSNSQVFVQNLPMQIPQNNLLYPNEFQASGMQNFEHVRNGMQNYGHVRNGMQDYGHVREGMQNYGHVRNEMQDYGHVREEMQDYGHVRNLDEGNNYRGYR